MKKRRLPTGIQNLRQIREEGYYYVDKTRYASRIAADGGKHYFLSRPRRFGKSLFVDTLKELYEGSEPLFRGLAVHDAWDWSRRRAVVRLSFAGGNSRGRASCRPASCSNSPARSAGPGCRRQRSSHPRRASLACWRHCTNAPASGWSSSWTSTTSRS